MLSMITMARDQQFCLRWNNYQTNLGQVFEQLLHAELFVDVTIACEGNNIRAHKIILSACSPYFHTVLQDTPCSHPVIILQGVKWTEMKAIVEFMYKGEINVGQEQLASLLQAAEYLKIRGLTDVGGEEAETVLTSPSESPRGANSFWGDNNQPRKKRKLSEEDNGRSSSRSRSPLTPSPRVGTPTSATEVLETTMDIPAVSLSRGSAASSVSNAPPSLPSPSPVASLASSLSSLAHLHGPMPPPGPPLPPHLAHLPPLSPLSPLLNMHHMSRHHSPEDFEIRPGIAEMIREEERKRRDIPDMAKLLESTHHWIANPMADSYQAQVQAAYQKSWNQTQSLLQNLRFRERGPLKSWRPETMAEAIHAVLKEGLSLSQAARKYDIPYPTFVLYANRVHNLLGPSHEPGDLRPKGRGRPQRILLGSWPEDQIKGVIRAVVFRDTTVFRDSDHKENKQPASQAAKLKQEAEASATAAVPNGPVTPSSNGTTSSTPEGSAASSPYQPSTSNATQPLPPAGTSLSPDAKSLPVPPPVTKKEPSPEEDSPSTIPPGPNSGPGSNSTPVSLNCVSPTTPSSNANSPKGVPSGPLTPQSRPSSTSSSSQQSSHCQMNGGTPHSNSPGSANKANGNSESAASIPSTSSNSQLGIMNHSMMSKSQSSSGQGSLSNQPSPIHNHHANAQLQHHQSQRNHPHSLFPQQHPQQPNHLQHSRGHGQSSIPPIAGSGHQQILGMIAGGMPPSASLTNSPVHMARLFGEGQPSHLPPRAPHGQPPINAFHHGFPRAGHPALPTGMGIMNHLNPLTPRIGIEDPQELSPDGLLFGKVTSPSEKHPFTSENGSRPNNHGQFEGGEEVTSPGSVERSLIFRDGLDVIKSEPEAIMN